MDHPLLLIDRISDQQAELLTAYHQRAIAQKATVEDFDGWLDRINDLQSIHTDALTAVHGQLIALGLLKFEIGSRQVGLRYQLSAQGRMALERHQGQSDDLTEETPGAELQPAASADSPSSEHDQPQLVEQAADGHADPIAGTQLPQTDTREVADAA